MKIFAHISWLFASIIIFIALATKVIFFYIIPKPYAPKVAAWIIRLLTFFRVEIEGKEDPEAQMFLLNHQSDIDICVMESITKRDLAWVAKKELFDIPFFGLVLRLSKDIAVERESKTALVKLIRDSKDRLDHGRVVTIFPEGTRSSGNKMLRFKDGAKVIADKYKLRVQPVVLMQTAKYYNVKKFYYKPGKIKVIYMDSFIADKNDDNWLKDLREKMQKVYDHELASNPRHR